jgi:hypothetical protein
VLFRAMKSRHLLPVRYPMLDAEDTCVDIVGLLGAIHLMTYQVKRDSKRLNSPGRSTALHNSNHSGASERGSEVAERMARSDHHLPSYLPAKVELQAEPLRLNSSPARVVAFFALLYFFLNYQRLSLHFVELLMLSFEQCEEANAKKRKN